MTIKKVVTVLFFFHPILIHPAADKSPATLKPVSLNLPAVSPEKIKSSNQIIEGIKQQLRNLENKNLELKNLVTEKKKQKNNIHAIYNRIQKEQEKNDPYTLQLQAEINKTKINPDIQKKMFQARQAIKVDYAQLNEAQKTIRTIKTKINRIAPERKSFLQKLRDAQQTLKELQNAATISKIKG